MRNNSLKSSKLPWIICINIIGLKLVKITIKHYNLIVSLCVVTFGRLMRNNSLELWRFVVIMFLRKLLYLGINLLDVWFSYHFGRLEKGLVLFRINCHSLETVPVWELTELVGNRMDSTCQITRRLSSLSLTFA